MGAPPARSSPVLEKNFEKVIPGREVAVIEPALMKGPSIKPGPMMLLELVSVPAEGVPNPDPPRKSVPVPVSVEFDRAAGIVGGTIAITPLLMMLPEMLMKAGLTPVPRKVKFPVLVMLESDPLMMAMVPLASVWKVELETVPIRMTPLVDALREALVAEES